MCAAKKPCGKPHPITCADCGVEIFRSSSRGPNPKRCEPCKKAKARRDVKAWADANPQKVAARQAARRKHPPCSACIDCGLPISSFGTRGPNAKRCVNCREIHAKEQRKACRRKLHEITCGRCKKHFLTSHKKQKYCSTECAHLADRSRVLLTCQQCNKSFEEKTKRAHSRRYCSWACWQKAHAAPTCKCQQCGRDFKRKVYVNAWQGKNKFCSRECAWDHRWGADRPRKATSEKAKRSWAQRSRATTLKHRCRYYECEFDPECTREAVCDRDGWVCQDCGVRCHKGEWRIDKKTRKASPRNAEHDHIWPLSVRGGPGNVMHNSQCLCRKCNGKKRNRRKGQMRINLSV